MTKIDEEALRIAGIILGDDIEVKNAVFVSETELDVYVIPKEPIEYISLEFVVTNTDITFSPISKSD